MSAIETDRSKYCFMNFNSINLLLDKKGPAIPGPEYRKLHSEYRKHSDAVK
jgi:hypothetical protein